MEIVINLLGNPLTKEIITNTTGHNGLSELRQPRDANFPVNEIEWHRIKQRFEKHELY
jgi:hypothetical protein